MAIVYVHDRKWRVEAAGELTLYSASCALESHGRALGCSV